jgi:putative DNA primase/helicase
VSDRIHDDVTPSAPNKGGFRQPPTAGLRSLNLPRDARDVIVLADGDDPGEAAAQDCARRWSRKGRRVRIARPPQGMDFNDLLKVRMPPSPEGVQ